MISVRDRTRENPSQSNLLSEWRSSWTFLDAVMKNLCIVFKAQNQFDWCLERLIRIGEMHPEHMSTVDENRLDRQLIGRD